MAGHRLHPSFERRRSLPEPIGWGRARASAVGSALGQVFPVGPRRPEALRAGHAARVGLPRRRRRKSARRETSGGGSLGGGGGGGGDAGRGASCRLGFQSAGVPSRRWPKPRRCPGGGSKRRGGGASRAACELPLPRRERFRPPTLSKPGLLEQSRRGRWSRCHWSEAAPPRSAAPGADRGVRVLRGAAVRRGGAPGGGGSAGGGGRLGPQPRRP
mmetsp:Transcript_59624/g.134910  ORF Transcript_59624/g.134910 Transcript_59624/m.134910 type:complete len:215 (+) Transcript_59624:369-1013(+)